MAIEIDNDYAVYQVTDTLHQLVDRLNHNLQKLDANIRVFDSSLNSLASEYQPAQIVADSDFAINADALTFHVDSSIVFNSSSFLINDIDDVEIRTPNSLDLVTGDDGVIFSTPTHENYGQLKRSGDQMSINCNGLPAMGFRPSDLFPQQFNQTIFSGEVSIPFLETTSPTIHGAINEVRIDAIEGFNADRDRLGVLETDLSDIKSDNISLHAKDANLEGRMQSLEALNISSRLNSIEANIQNILLRLNILEI